MNENHEKFFHDNSLLLLTLNIGFMQTFMLGLQCWF